MPFFNAILNEYVQKGNVIELINLPWFSDIFDLTTKSTTVSETKENAQMQSMVSIAFKLKIEFQWMLELFGTEFHYININKMLSMKFAVKKSDYYTFVTFINATFKIHFFFCNIKPIRNNLWIGHYWT